MAKRAEDCGQFFCVSVARLRIWKQPCLFLLFDGETSSHRVSPMSQVWTRAASVNERYPMPTCSDLPTGRLRLYNCQLGEDFKIIAVVRVDSVDAVSEHRSDNLQVKYVATRDRPTLLTNPSTPQPHGRGSAISAGPEAPAMPR